ncbi:MAG TPA: TolC family protein [Gemmatimonadaceae bacterium]|nr:TolC family protein [Gemmatimonadaceae bacterium]
MTRFPTANGCSRSENPLRKLLFLCGWPVGLLAQPQPLSLTLDSAVALGTRGATAVLQARDVARLGGALVLERYAQFLPDLRTGGLFDEYSGNVLLSQRDIHPTDTRFRELGYHASSSLNLFNGFADVAGVKAALATRSAADLTVTRAEQTIALDVAQSFLGVTLDQQLVAIATQNVTASQLRVEQLQELVRVGKRPPADLYRQQAQAAADQSTLEDARNRVQSDEVGLLERIRQDPHVPVQLIEPVADTGLLGAHYSDIDGLVREATTRRADLQAADADVTANRADITRARAGYLPRLDLGASVFSLGRFFDYAATNGSSLLTTPQTPLVDQIGHNLTGEVWLGLNWYVFDQFRTRLSVERAKVSYDASQYVDQDLRLSVAGDVVRAIADYRTAVNQFNASRAGLDAAQQAYDLVNGRFQVGFASIVDVTTAQTALVQAQSLRAQAMVNLALRKKAVGYALGLDPTAALPQ